MNCVRVNRSGIVHPEGMAVAQAGDRNLCLVFSAGCVGRSELRPTGDRTGALKELAEGPEQEAGESHSYRQSQDPGHQQVADCAPLQAGVICRHGTRDARR